MTLAWHTAAFQRSKKLPRLTEVAKALNANKRQSGREQYKLMAQWLSKRTAPMKEKTNGSG